MEGRSWKATEGGDLGRWCDAYQPHAMPHMSKAALGHEARRRMPMKPCFSVKAIVKTFIFEIMS